MSHEGFQGLQPLTKSVHSFVEVKKKKSGYFLNPLPVSRDFFRKSSALFLQGGFSGVPRFFCKGRVVVGRSTG